MMVIMVVVMVVIVIVASANCDGGDDVLPAALRST